MKIAAPEMPIATDLRIYFPHPHAQQSTFWGEREAFEHPKKTYRPETRAGTAIQEDGPSHTC
jgi:hypothetical protein